MTSVMTFSQVEPQEVGPLAHSPLRVALVQARTTPVLALERPEGVERLLEALDGQWTLTDRQLNREMGFQMGPAGVRPHVGSEETVWVLSTDAADIRAAVSASSVAVDSESYESWASYRDALRQVLAAVGATFAPARCVRLGVRYVNEIDVARAGSDPSLLVAQINEALVAPALALGNSIVSSLAELRTAEDEDGGVLALRHGLVDSNTYLLDFDAYRELAEPFDPDKLVERAERFHARIESVFAWALTDAYLDELRGVSAA
jgi:uncharacterized protein (TIGR04255 family)